MARIRFANGKVVNFNGNPTPEDIEEVASSLGFNSPYVSGNPPLNPERPTSPVTAAASDLAVRGITLPLRNPIMDRMTAAANRVESSVQDVAGRVAESGNPLTATLMSLGAEYGNLSPENMALNVGGEAFGRVAVPAAGRLVSRIAKRGAKKGMNSVLGPSEEAIVAALKDPTVLTATVEDLTRSLPNVGRKFDLKIKELSKPARESLSSSRFIQPSPTDPGGAFTKDEVFSAVERARKKLGGTYGKEGRAAAKALENLKEDFAKLHNTVSQEQVHDVIFKLDDEINWDRVWNTPEDLTPTERAMVNSRSYLDRILKVKNTAYAKAMLPVDEAMHGRKEFAKNFGIKKIPGEGWIASDQAYNRTRSALREGKIETERVLKQTNKIIGEDLTPKIRKANYGEEFRGGKTQGSRNVNIGAFVGGSTGAGAGALFGSPMIGGGAGSAAGALAGSYIDKHGAEIAADLIRRYLGTIPMTKQVGQVVAPIVRTAEKLPFTSPLSIAARIAAQRNGER